MPISSSPAAVRSATPGSMPPSCVGEIGLNYKGILQVVMPENYIAMFNAPGEEESRAHRV